MTEESYGLLVTAGDAPADVISQAWLSIYSEYMQHTGGGQMSSFITSAKQIALLEYKIFRMRALITCLRDRFSLELVDQITASGYHIVYSEKDTAILTRSLAAIESALNTDELRLKQLVAALPVDNAATKPKEEDFRLTLMEISKFEGQRLTVDNISTLDYCMYVKRLQDHIALLNKQNRNHGRRSN